MVSRDVTKLASGDGPDSPDCDVVATWMSTVARSMSPPSRRRLVVLPSRLSCFASVVLDCEGWAVVAALAYRDVLAIPISYC